MSGVSLIDGHMDERKPELKPCPFCGGEAEVAKGFLYGKVTGYSAYCKKCGCESKVFATKQNAENFWNRRADN